VSRRGAIVAALMIAASILVGVFARIATTDAMLLLATTAAMGAMARAYRAQFARNDHANTWILPGIFWTVAPEPLNNWPS
jgi:4-amino-4-deoxy-L-arabinose transferase-like glycosyltransferase